MKTKNSISNLNSIKNMPTVQALMSSHDSTKKLYALSQIAPEEFKLSILYQDSEGNNPVMQTIINLPDGEEKLRILNILAPKETRYALLRKNTDNKTPFDIVRNTGSKDTNLLKTIQEILNN